MKRFNLILAMFMGLMIYFLGYKPYSAVIYDDIFQAKEIDIPPESPDTPAPVYIEPSPSLVPPSYPYFNTNPPENSNPIYPLNFSFNKNVEKERTSAQNNN
jgi:hypothetical protein